MTYLHILFFVIITGEISVELTPVIRYKNMLRCVESQELWSKLMILINSTTSD